MTSAFRPEVRRTLPLLVAHRFVLNLAARMLYTFLPSFARGSGLSVDAMGRTIAAGELTSLLAPWTGRLTDRFTAKRIMSSAALLTTGALLSTVFGVVGLIAGVVVFGISRTAYQVAMNSWIGEEVAYERRGRATGFVELAWGGSNLLGIPLMGLLIDTVGWRAPFIVCGLAMLPVSWLIERRDASGRSAGGVATRRPVMTPSVWATLAVSAAMTGAAQVIVFSHGLWLEDTYSLDSAEVGLAVVAVGAIEVVATLSSAGFTDRIGKTRSMLGGTALLGVALLLLALFPAPPLWAALVLLVVAFLGFEYGIVSSIPLVAELDPAARAQMVGRWVMVTTVARSVVTIAAGWMYTSRGFSSVMTFGVVLAAVAVVAGAAYMREPAPTPPD